jgi:hypothetical protein
MLDLSQQQGTWNGLSLCGSSFRMRWDVAEWSWCCVERIDSSAYQDGPFENSRPNAVVGLEFPFYLFCGYIFLLKTKICIVKDNWRCIQTLRRNIYTILEIEGFYLVKLACTPSHFYISTPLKHQFRVSYVTCKAHKARRSVLLFRFLPTNWLPQIGCYTTVGWETSKA